MFDLNDCYVKDEVYLHKSSIDLYVYKLGYVLLLISGVIAFSVSKGDMNIILLGTVLLLSSYLLFNKSRNYSIELDEVQLIINLEGIKYKDSPLVKWENVENERIEEEVKNAGSSESETIHFFTCYLKDTDSNIVIKSNDIEIDIYVLVSIFKIFRHRNKQANAQQ